MDNLWLCVAITSGMALVIGLAQPFAQPQMNVLQSACFACAWPWMHLCYWKLGSELGFCLKTGASLLLDALLSKTGM